MERMPEAEWGANPREWVTVMRARRAQSDTSEPDLCSCRHRESMDEFFWSARLVAVRTFCLALFLPRKAPSGKLHNPCAFRAVCADPPLRCAVNKKSPLRRWEPPKGDFFADEIAIGRLCPAAGAGRFQQNLLHLRPLRFHVRREPQLRAAAVEVLRWPVDLEIDIAVQIVLQKAHTKLDRDDLCAKRQDADLIFCQCVPAGVKIALQKCPVKIKTQEDLRKIRLILRAEDAPKRTASPKS